MSRAAFDAAKREITIEEVGERCGTPLQVHGSGSNVRIDCPFDCPGDHAGRREISINVEHPDKLLRCHRHDCPLRGDVIHLVHGLLTGKRPDGVVKGKDFLRAKKVILGQHVESTRQQATSPQTATEPKEPDASVPAVLRNVPLERSDNEAARALVGLEELFITDAEQMRPKVSRYWRERRHFLTAELCAEWGVGVRPANIPDDKRGFSLRNHICYRFDNENGKPLGYVARDPEYEDKLAAFEATPKEERERKKLKASIKHKFPKGFHRGVELYGQQRQRFDRHPEYRDFVAQHGIIVVQGFNDVLALDHHGIPAVGICSDTMTEQQAMKVIRWAKALGNNGVALMFACDEQGDDGAMRAMWLLKQLAPEIDVRTAWSRRMHGGQFDGMQPENLSSEDVGRAIVSVLT